MDEQVTLADGLMVFETDAICEKLTQAGIRFELSQVSATDAGIGSPRKSNWAAALTHVCNYFNQGGLGVYMRIRVAADDFEKAKAVIAPTDRKRTDGKRLLMWILGGAVLVLLLYAFTHPRSHSTAFAEDAEIVALSSEEEVLPPECEFAPATLELELTVGTNRADGTFFGFDFDRRIEKYPHRGNDFWCKIGTAWMCGGKDGKCKHEDYYLVCAELKKPFHGFTNLNVKCEYGGERKYKASVLEFMRKETGKASIEQLRKWADDLCDDVAKRCDVAWGDCRRRSDSTKDWIIRKGTCRRMELEVRAATGKFDGCAEYYLKVCRK